ncbi:uncharacterized protein LOC115447783 [Manduca sexta]|uniref:uncharacterized protein LOC115447783 n=1 Tax=Manduca sexta TaxID=7130 RepID=UPI001182504F|nr:uncharacterized protein LOC115447783 [Manduca sexta]
MLATIAPSVLIWMMVIITPSNGAHTITPLPYNQSLYFDPLAKAQLVRDKWTLIVYFDMEPYWAGIKTYTKITEYLDKLCNKNHEHSQCNMIVTQLRHDYQELEYYNELLLCQHFNERSKQVRSRRGLINGIGNMANELFGVLDSRFADQYTKDIEATRANEKHLLQLWKNQTSLIESEFNLMKTMETTIKKQHTIINAKLDALNNNTIILQGQIHNITRVQDFTLTAMAGNNLLQSLKRLQETLLDTITDIYHGQISLHLLTPRLLRSELQLINSQVSNDLKLPIQNIETDLHDIYRLLKVKARVTQKFVIFEVTFPLISREVFQLYRLIPIPRKFNNDMVAIVPAAEYIALNLDHDSYFPLTAHELDKCLYHVSSYICDTAKPIERLENDEVYCDHTNHTCKVEKTICTNKLIELNATSQYLFFYCEAHPIKIICNNHISVEQFNRAGIIRLSPECVIKGKDFTLYPHRREFNQIEISPDIYSPEVDQINNIVNLTFPTDEVTNTDMEKSFAKVHEEIQNSKSAGEVTDDVISYHDIHQYVVSYALWLVVLCITVILLWRRRSRNIKKYSDSLVMVQ